MKCMRHWSPGMVCVLILAVCLPAMAVQSPAEKLISKVPGNPVAVMATSGLAQVKPAFDKTFLGRVTADNNVRKFALDIFNQGLKLAGGDVPDANMVKEIRGIVTDVAQCPLLVGVGQLAEASGVVPVPLYGYLYIDASQNKDKIQALLTRFNEEVAGDKLAEIEVQGVKLFGPEDDQGVPGYWGWVGDILVLGVNDAEGLAVKALKSDTSVSIESLAKLPIHGDAFLEYVDYQKVLSLVTTLQQDEDAKKMMTTLFTRLGVTNIKTVAIRCGFDGANMVLDSFVGLAGPRSGIQALVKPVSSDLLSMVPDKAMTASVSSFDVPGLYDLAVKTADELTQGQATQMVDMGVGMVMAQFGVDVREAIIKNLDGPMLGYAVPQGVIPEAMNGGPVGILTLKDPEAFAKVLLTAEQLGTSLAQGQFQAGTQENEGRTLHTWAVGPLAMMQMVPTWTVVDNHFVISTDTSLCALAAKQVASRNKVTSLLNTDGFKKASANLPQSVLSLSYVDTRNQIKQVMSSLQRIWPMGAMLAGAQGVQLPMMLPSVDHLMTDLVPVCNYSNEKDGGIYGHYQGTGVELALGVGVGAGMGVAMPFITKQRSQTSEAASSSEQ
ncbi:MAG: DUF3352 domain-containing protein [Phycisphaerae bacterium]|nr:DUF3352 domain-containing protein [Phycisphaerae bacterium]